MLTLCIALSLTVASQAVIDMPQAPVTAVNAPASLHQISLPLGHPVVIVIDEQVGSKISTTGDYFAISLAEPVIVDGSILIPAGAKGKGQIVHAKKGGFSGSAGELILAARYIEHDGQQIKLRSMKFAETGRDNTGTSMAAGIAGGAVGAAIGFLISGGNTIVEPGITANAKFAEDTRLISVPQEIESSGLSENSSGSEVNE